MENNRNKLSIVPLFLTLASVGCGEDTIKNSSTSNKQHARQVYPTLAESHLAAKEDPKGKSGKLEGGHAAAEKDLKSKSGKSEGEHAAAEEDLKAKSGKSEEGHAVISHSQDATEGSKSVTELKSVKEEVKAKLKTVEKDAEGVKKLVEEVEESVKKERLKLKKLGQDQGIVDRDIIRQKAEIKGFTGETARKKEEAERAVKKLLAGATAIAEETKESLAKAIKIEEKVTGQLKKQAAEVMKKIQKVVENIDTMVQNIENYKVKLDDMHISS